jgi:hypothetical protein
VPSFVPLTLHQAGLGLILGGCFVLLLTRIWQVALLALLLVYVGVGMLGVAAGAPGTAGLRVLAGGLICLVLFLTARHRQPGRGRVSGGGFDRHWLSTTSLRVAAAALAGLAAFESTLPHRFPTVPEYLATAAVWLIAIGLVVALLARRLLWVAMGAPLAMTGFDMLYTGLDPRLITAGVLSAAALLSVMLIAATSALIERA